MKTSKWNSKGSGLRKHRISGVPHNHANTIAQVREENKRLEEEAENREKKKGKRYSSVRELLNS